MNLHRDACPRREIRGIATVFPGAFMVSKGCELFADEKKNHSSSRERKDGVIIPARR